MMRLPRFALAVAVATLILAPGRHAAAQATMPVGKCTGSITADIGFAAMKDGETTLGSISQTYAPNVFGRAECDCNPDEASGKGIYMLLQISSGLPQGTVTNVSAWVGSGCDNYQTRINTSAVSCKQFTPTNLTPSSFNAGSGNIGVSTPYDLYVPARALFSPAAGTCDTDATNSIWIFLGTNPMTPDGTCTVSISQRATGSSPAVDPQAQSGDSAVNLTWKAPTTLNTTNLRTPRYYQVLCADMNGQALVQSPRKPAAPAYSTCLSTGLRRRQNIFGASNISSPTNTDGGTAVADMTLGTSSQALGGSAPTPADVADLAGADLATNPNDQSPRETHFDGIGPFATLDPAFICGADGDEGGKIVDAQTTTTFNVRVGGLVNGAQYQFVVLAIDDYGNATPSAIVTGTPKPVEDLYGRYRDAGGSAQGFCFVATAAYGDYDHPQVRVLRAFRDRVLAGSGIGRALVRAYYAASPPLARFIAGSDARRAIARGLLWPVVGFALLALHLGSLALACLVAGGVPALMLWAWRRLRRRRAARWVTP